MNDIEQIIDEASKKISSSNITELEIIKIKYLGKNSILTHILKSIYRYSTEDRKKIGSQANKAKVFIENEIKKRKESLEKFVINEKLKNEKLDCSQSLYFPFTKGSFHPVIKTVEDMTSVFRSLGFFTAEGCEIENDWYNFEALNIPKGHPARDFQDTFYIENTDNLLLRTHTSPSQIHIMEKQKPPVKVIVPGRVYRNENSDASHSSTFHQIEGLAVDKGVTFKDLKYILTEFVNIFFGSNLKIRFRPSHFQFTEPSAEIDIQCFSCCGNGCRLCKNSGFIEILGCGMVHPNVFKAVNYDYEKYTGYAFGIGVERIAMLKYGIDDIRLLYENDLRFLRQFL
ncbi:MAG: phenylalanine--tRNA ligase subunit alpha [Endomicrobium sp.]|nr:phenylalanine--tRNA ligase subunit alpha [Endomicrobium sp.]